MVKPAVMQKRFANVSNKLLRFMETFQMGSPTDFLTYTFPIFPKTYIAKVLKFALNISAF